MELDPPDRTFGDEGTDLDVGGRRIELRWLGRGHTDDDIVVRVPDAGVLFAGDLLENGATPYFGDGFPLDWPATADGPPGARHRCGRARPRRRRRSRVRRPLDRRASGRSRTSSGGSHAGELDLEAAIAAAPYPAADAVEPLERGLAQLRGELG